MPIAAKGFVVVPTSDTSASRWPPIAPTDIGEISIELLVPAGTTQTEPGLGVTKLSIVIMPARAAGLAKHNSATTAQSAHGAGRFEMRQTERIRWLFCMRHSTIDGWSYSGRSKRVESHTAALMVPQVSSRTLPGL